MDAVEPQGPGPWDAAMVHALDLASRGPVTGGNPQVGCVLLDGSGAIVAEGWHRGAGTPHAEIDALSRLQGTTGADTAGRDARGLTAVVTLEPCAHTGRTGPCCVALAEAGVARVVYGLTDPGRESGGGAAYLREHGVETTGGVLADRVEELVEVWLTSVRRGRPWVTVKWASTLDGRAAADDGTSRWITGAAARQRVHEERGASDAILVGTGTVLADDPELTARGDGGELLAHQPLPVVVGERAVPAEARLRAHPAGLLETRSRDLGAILAELDARGLRRVYVEGGPTLATAVLAAGLADELSVYLAPTLVGGRMLAIGDLGIRTMVDAQPWVFTAVESLGDDIHARAVPRDAGRRKGGR